MKNMIGGLLAVAIGVAVGVMLAPRSGEQTRKKMTRKSKRFALDIKDAIEDGIGSLKDQFNSAVEETAKRGKSAISNASERVKI
jgi:gas vesicle protein